MEYHGPAGPGGSRETGHVRVGCARIAREILVRTELRRIDEHARDDDSACSRAMRDQRIMARMQIAHRRHERDALAALRHVARNARRSRARAKIGMSMSVAVLGAGKFARTHRVRVRASAPTIESIAVTLFHLPVETIGTRFGGIPSGLPTFAIPDCTTTYFANFVARIHGGNARRYRVAHVRCCVRSDD